ncbi:hypothetical protein MHU86_15025 [Fragilaria crotonensis]|nr:hypothetical protein MHU86_15025 [Fragilaria crotonensis]
MSVILATGGYDHKIRFGTHLWGLFQNTALCRFPSHALTHHPDRQFLAAAGNPHIRLYEIHNPDPTMENPVLSLEGHTASVTSIGFQRDGRYMYSGSEDGTVVVGLAVTKLFSFIRLQRASEFGSVADRTIKSFLATRMATSRFGT